MTPRLPFSTAPARAKTLSQVPPTLVDRSLISLRQTCVHASVGVIEIALPLQLNIECVKQSKKDNIRGFIYNSMCVLPSTAYGFSIMFVSIELTAAAEWMPLKLAPIRLPISSRPVGVWADGYLSECLSFRGVIIRVRPTHRSISIMTAEVPAFQS